MESHLSQSDPGPTSFERRRVPRVEVLGQLHGAIVALRMPIRVRDASQGGFSIETTLPFPDGAEHQFRFTTGQNDVLVLTARSVYCVPANSGDADPLYLTGFEFLPVGKETRTRIVSLVDALSSLVMA